MADITVTAANVRPFSGATIKEVTAGAAVTAGQIVYKDTTDSNEHKAADAAAAASATIAGMAMTNAGDGEPLLIATGGYVNPGGTVGVGVVYTCSSNAGGIAPNADLTSGNYVSTFGIGITASKIWLTIHNSGIARA